MPDRILNPVAVRKVTPLEYREYIRDLMLQHNMRDAAYQWYNETKTYTSLYLLYQRAKAYLPKLVTSE